MKSYVTDREEFEDITCISAFGIERYVREKLHKQLFFDSWINDASSISGSVVELSIITDHNERDVAYVRITGSRDQGFAFSISTPS